MAGNSITPSSFRRKAAACNSSSGIHHGAAARRTWKPPDQRGQHDDELRECIWFVTHATAE
jgi:hypothetical protein